MRVGIGQIDSHVGAIAKNTERILSMLDEAKNAHCDLVVFPELAIPGYVPQDLLWRPGFVADCEKALAIVREHAGSMTVVVGSVGAKPTHDPINRADVSSATDGAGVDLFNIACLLQEGRESARIAKTHLPTFDVYNEKRYFTPSPGVEIRQVAGLTAGINICEDIWVEDGPTDLQASLGAEWILNLSASPFYVGKPAIRRKLICRRASQNHVGIVYVNLVGGQDDVVFDGGSFIVNSEGRFLFQAPRFEEGLFVTELPGQTMAEPTDDPVEQLRGALVLGIRDYVRKNGFASAILGLSGGVDSAVVAALAVDALGPGNVTSAFLPSEFSSDESRDDAAEVAANLGIEHIEVSIEEIHHAARSALPSLAEGLVDENLQPRIRGMLLMALSNQKRGLVLCPGNKSEIAMGYNTLYGDTVGALAPIADLYKDDVYRLASSYGPLIPARVMEKPPSAELRPNQRDDDDLPPYPILDPILRAVIEHNASRGRLLQQGFEPELVNEVLRRYYQNEYKRRQLPPGIKVTPKAFGSGRRIPITHGYRD